MIAEFAINVVEEHDMKMLKEKLTNEYQLKFSKDEHDIFVVEGCLKDDRTVLGGRSEFLSHFCTFYNFNICYSLDELSGTCKLDKAMSDPDFVGKRID